MQNTDKACADDLSTSLGISKNMTKYDKMLTEYDKNYQIHVEKHQERHFLEIKKANSKIYTWFGVGGDWGTEVGTGVLGYKGGIKGGVGEMMPP